MALVLISLKPLVHLGAAGALLTTDNALPAAPIGLLGLLLLVQVSMFEEALGQHVCNTYLTSEREPPGISDAEKERFYILSPAPGDIVGCKLLP